MIAQAVNQRRHWLGVTLMMFKVITSNWVLQNSNFLIRLLEEIKQKILLLGNCWCKNEKYIDSTVSFLSILSINMRINNALSWNSNLILLPTNNKLAYFKTVLFITRTRLYLYPWMQRRALNVSALSDALCIRITHTQPCIRPFYVHMNAGRGNSRWQLNSRGAPPQPRPRLCTLTDGDQAGESRVGTLWARSGFQALWKDLSAPFRSDGVSHVLHCSQCSDNNPLYLSHLRTHGEDA